MCNLYEIKCASTLCKNDKIFNKNFYIVYCIIFGDFSDPKQIFYFSIGRI